MDQIRPDRQTMMFSATFPREIQLLANENLENHIKIIVGRIGAANTNIRQVVEVLLNEDLKMEWLKIRLKKFIDFGPVLIFVSKIKDCEELTSKIRKMKIPCGLIHGDFDQRKREEVLKKFSTGNCKLLVATDVAARGLHIDNLKTVVNFDAPRNLETHINRVGRTGRAGKNGIAYTLLTPNNKKEASFIKANLIQSKQPVNSQLENLIKDKNVSETTNLKKGMQFTKESSNKNFRKRKAVTFEKSSLSKSAFSKGFIKSNGNK
ncbi:hypothetical protein MHBO_003794 [Bonamia ostreae]|uniref:Helicase C-terminal domain-containing protein n=1 Tax=Bonamia ostreae TaxID=126728 RepID=A0ABV2ARW1_9EUKA